MNMVVTLQQVLRPFFYTCFIMGLGFYSRKQSKIRWFAHLNILYSLTIWVAFVHLYFYSLIYFSKKTLFESAAMEILEEIYVFISITSAFMSFYHQKIFGVTIKKLAAVDDTLEKLGTPKMYEKMHMRLKQIIIGWIVYILAMNFSDPIFWLSVGETASWGLYIVFILNHCLHINAFVDLLFTFFLWYIGTRFDKVNEHIRCLLVGENHGLRYSWRKPVVALHRYTLCINHKRTLWTIMHLHLELCRLARDLNLIFAVQMTFEVAFYFPYLTTIFYHSYMTLTQEYRNKIYTIYEWINIISWVFIILTRIYIVNSICESVRIKAIEISKILHQLPNILRYADVWKEIYQFTLQTMHHPLKFTGMGLFYFGYKFLQKFCMAILMHVIIMVQLKIPVSY